MSRFDFFTAPPRRNLCRTNVFASCLLFRFAQLTKVWVDSGNFRGEKITLGLNLDPSVHLTLCYRWTHKVGGEGREGEKERECPFSVIAP